MISTNDALIVDGDDPFVPDVPDRFRVADEQSANWVVRKVTEARNYADQVRAWAATEIRRAENDERFFLMRFEAQLRVWTAQQIAGKKRKSVNLPGGTLGYRNCPARLVVDDESKVISWARKECPAAVVTTTVTKLTKAVLDEHLATTGELPTGAHIESPQERFFIR